MDILTQNTNKKRPMVKGSVRGGAALLGGLLRCGHCGRKLFVRYQGRNGSHKRYDCSRKQGNDLGKACISFGGFRVDRAVTEYLFEVLSPIGLEASVKAIKNRLVAATLERDWNDALVNVEKLENEISAMVANTPPLSPEEEAEIRELSQDLPRVWNHTRSSLNLKKRIIRTVIKEIVVYLEEQNIKLIIHWEGGEHTKLEVLKNKSFDYPLRTDVETRKIISALARIMPDKHIVAFLNRIGKATAKGHTWNPVRLRSFRNNNNIPVYREGERQEREEFTVDEASSKLGIGSTKARRLIQHKILPARQVCSGAPWIIFKKDLESEAVKKAAHSKLPKRPLPEKKRPLPENLKQEVLNFQ
jgi:hypothetical protein